MRIASEVCSKADVACVNYTEAIRMLDERRSSGDHHAANIGNSAG